MSVQNFNPYVGLRPFHADENLLFFGRDQQTLELLQRLHKHRFVAVVGGSGSGKSSLIRAGLIPALKGGYLVEDSSKWFITTMKPGSSPVYNLAETLLRQVDPNANEEAISELVNKIKRERTSAILNLLSPLRKGKNANFFLLIDQFEELFRFSMEQQDSEKKTQAIDFVNLVLELSKQKALPFYVVLTMRSDFIGDCAQFRHLPEAMNKSQYLVPRITRQQLKKIIEGPARLYGGKFNPAMTTRLINDLEKVKDELPLLQHALMRMWDHEVNVDKSGELDFEDYNRIGGIENALSLHATEALEGMSKEDLDITKELFQALTAIDENGRKIRRPLLLSDLRKLTGASETKLLGIIDNFIRDKRSFLIVEKAGEKDQVIDISHESLIRQWHTLNLWVEEEHDAASYYLQLADATRLHQADKKDYLTGSELSLALEWKEKFKPTAVWANRYRKGFDKSIAYLETSEKERDRLLLQERSRRRKIRILAGAIMGLILLFGIYAITSNISIREQKDKLETTNASLNQANEEIKKRALSDSLNKEEALRQKEIAVEALKSADSALSISIEQRKIARDAKLLAEFEAINAKIQTALAKAQKDTAQIQFERAEGLRVSASKKKDAFELHFQAKVLKSKDPTLALRLEQQAIELYEYPEFEKAALDLIGGNSFYKIILKDSTAVSEVVISQDQKRIVTGHIDGMIKVWDGMGKLMKEFKAHNVNISYLALSPNGKSILTSGDNTGRTARLWNLEGIMQSEFISKEKLSNPNSYVYAFTPDNKPVLIESEITENVRPFETVHRLMDLDGNLITTLKTLNQQIFIASMIFSPDGESILAVTPNSDSDQSIMIWDMQGNLKTTIATKTIVLSATFAPDSKSILTGYWRASAERWNLEGESLGTFSGHLGSVLSVAFSPDGKQVLTGSFDNTVRLWDLEGNSLKEFKGHTGEISSIKFSSDGDSVLSGSRDGTVRSWSLKGVSAAKFDRLDVAVRSVAFAPHDGNTILTGSGGRADLWNLDGEHLRKFDSSGEGVIYSAVFEPDGQTILTGSEDGTVQLWNLNGTRIRNFGSYQYAVQSVAFDSDGKYFLIGTKDRVELRSIEGSYLKYIRSENAVTSVAFAPDGKSFLAGTYGKSLLWDLEGNLITEFMEPSGLFVNGVAFSPDGQFVLTGSNDHSARLWNLKGEIIQTFSGPRGAVRSVAFAPDGKSIMTGSAGGIARIWDLDGNILEEYKGNNGTVFSVAYAPDNKSIVMGSQREAFLMKRIQLEEFLKSANIEPLSEAQKKEYGIKD